LDDYALHVAGGGEPGVPKKKNCWQKASSFKKRRAARSPFKAPAIPAYGRRSLGEREPPDKNKEKDRR